MKRDLESMHRERKRRAEMEIAISRLKPYLNGQGGRKVLEFGSGRGYQIPYLRRLGSVVASDVSKERISPDNLGGADFVVCDIRNTPFDSQNFDLIFSSHVIEHIEDQQKAFSELRRIGREGCLYAFTVPTDIWLWASVPAQFYNGLRGSLRKKRAKEGGASGIHNVGDVRAWQRFLPRGHGWRKGFFDCLDSLRIESWRSLFAQNGFEIMETTPLLLYAPSEFPVIPTMRFPAIKGLCSSVLFIMKKKTPQALSREVCGSTGGEARS